MSLLRRMLMKRAESEPLTPPPGYSFIEFTMQAYDSGIIPNDVITEIDFRSTRSGNFSHVFGIEGQYCLYQAFGRNGFIGFNGSTANFNEIPANVTDRHKCTLDPVTRRVLLDDSEVDTPTTQTGLSTFTFWINGIRKADGSGIWGYGSDGVRSNEIFSIKLYNGANNKLILYALPVKNDATNAEAMYDFVNDRFLEVIQ